MQIFDEFMLAIETEAELKFDKDSKDSYCIEVFFEENRKQKVRVSMQEDETKDFSLSFYSIVYPIKNASNTLLTNILKMNTIFSYGALGIKNGNFVFCYSYYAKSLDPEEFIKILYYIAAKADELQEFFEKL